MLVNLELARSHLRLDDDAADDLIVRKIEQASDVVIDYCKVDDEMWDPDSTESVALPGEVEAAVLLVLEALFDGGEPLSDAVKSLLHRHRDPALA